MAKYRVQTDNGTYEVETEEPTFLSELTDGKKFVKAVLDSPGQMLNGLGTLAQKAGENYVNSPLLQSMGPTGSLGAGVQAAYSGVLDPNSIKQTAANIAQRTGDLVTGSVPVIGPALQTGFDYAANPDAQTPAGWGAQLRNGIAQAPLQGALMGAGYGVGKYFDNKAALAQQQSAALADPATQAGIRYATNRGFLDTPTAKQTLANGQITPELQDAVGAAQQEAQATARPLDPNFPDVTTAKDYLPGTAMGMPEGSSSMRPYAASETMAESAPTLIQSGAYNGGARINPYTGKFEGPPVPLRDGVDLSNKLEQASVDLVGARKTTVNALDQAMQTVNGQSPGAPKIRGIMFDTDVAPMLDDLRGQIQQRAMLKQTAPWADDMQAAYNKIEASVDGIQNSGAMSRWNKIGPDGSRQMGEVLPSEALSLIENMNAYRRALGEFDELSKAKGLNSTFSDAAARGNELNSMKQVQGALQGVLESKASEILSHVPSVKGFYNWQQALAPVTDSSLATMNKTYGAFQDAQEGLNTYNNTTNRGFVTPESGRLVTTQKQGQQLGNQVVDAFGNPVKAALNKVGEMMGKPAPVNNPNLQSAQINLRRPNAVISQVLDGLLLRDKPVPILSRDWNVVKNNPDAMGELAGRAAAYMGVTNLLDMPEFIQKQVHAAVITANPQGAEQLPGKANVVDGEWQNPQEKDAFVKGHILNSDAMTRATNIGPTFSNRAPKTVVTPSVAIAPQNNAMPPNVIDKVHSALMAPTPYQPPQDFSMRGEGKSVIDELQEYASRVSGDFIKPYGGMIQ